MKKYLLILIPVLLLTACKNEKGEADNDQAESTQSDQLNNNFDSSFPDNPIQLQDPCKILTIEDIEGIFNVPGTIVNIKSGMTNQAKAQQNNASCFFTWENNGLNGGFLLQLMKNPLYGEFDNWASSYIEVLATNGETSYPDNIQYKYSKIDGLADGAVYNDDLGKVYWRLGEDLVVGIIFRNTDEFASLEEIGKTMAQVINPRIEIRK